MLAEAVQCIKGQTSGGTSNPLHDAEPEDKIWMYLTMALTEAQVEADVLAEIMDHANESVKLRPLQVSAIAAWSLLIEAQGSEEDSELEEAARRAATLKAICDRLSKKCRRLFLE